MNIAIDITPLSSTHSLRGVGVYTKNLVDALQKYESHHSYSLFTRKQKVPDKADIVHYPYFDPFFLTLPLTKPKPTVVTVHDLIPLVFPDHFPAGLRGKIKWFLQKTSLKGASRILTDSENSRRDIHRVVRFDASDIDVIPLAPAPIFYEGRNIESNAGVAQKYHVSTPYLLYVGDVNWNKNIANLLRAFACLIKKNQKINISLILVGNAFVNSAIPETQEIIREIQNLGIENRVTMPGFVPEEDLVQLYKQAEALVLPSRYEGFGFPIVEAFASGCPVISTANSSLSEIIGPAIQVGEQEKRICDGIQTVLSLSKGARSKLIEEGLIYSRKFTWQRVAKETIAAYERALA